MIWQMGSITSASVWDVGAQGAYSASFSIDTVGVANVFADGAIAVPVTGVDLNTVTSAIIETVDSVYQSDVTASYSASDASNATFNHARGVVPLTTSSYQLRLALSDGITTVYRNITITPAAGYQVAELAGTLILTDPESAFAPYTGPDPVVGDQYIVPAATPAGAPITANQDSTLGYDYNGIDPVPSSESHSAEYWSSDGVGRVWSSSTITVAESAIATTSVDVPAAATYGPGDTLAFVVYWNKAAYVAGAPRIAITMGSGSVYATYTAGHGSNALTFTATVPSGDQYTGGIAVGALELNGGSIQDVDSANASLTLNGLGDTSAILVDTQGPLVTGVSVPAPGTYSADSVLSFLVNFDETVVVSGAPKLPLNIGLDRVYAAYDAQTGNSTLRFRYTVEVGREDTNGIFVDTLELNGGSIKDGQGNNATLTLNGVGDTSGVLVDAIGPKMTGMDVPAAGLYTPGDVLTFIVHFDVATTIAGTPRIVVSMGGSAVYPMYVSGSGTPDLTFTYTVTAGDFDTDGIYVAGLEANGGSLVGSDGNDADLTLVGVGDTSGILVDGVSPILTIGDVTTTSITPTITGTCGDATSLTLTVTDGGAYSEVYNPSPSGSNWSQVLGAMSAGTYTMTLDGSDANGNASVQVSATLVIADALSVVSVDVPAASTYGVGEILPFSVNWTVPASVSGQPTLELVIGSQAVQAIFVGGADTTKLDFEYTAKSGDLDEDGIAVSGINLNGGSIEDDLNQGAILTLNGIGDTSGVHVVAVIIDLTPDQFSFPTKINQPVGTVVESNPITVSGITSGRDVPLTVTGGEHSISTNGGASWSEWSTLAATVRLGHMVKLRHTTSALNGTGATTTADINGVSAQFMSVTQSAGGGGDLDLSSIAQPIASTI